MFLPNDPLLLPMGDPRVRWAAEPHRQLRAGSAGTPAAAGPRSIVGTLPYDVLSDYASNDDGGMPVRVVLLAGCFAPTLDRLSDSDAPTVRLVHGHDLTRAIASTADGTLRVWQTAAGLHFRACGVPPARLVGCSAGFPKGESVLHRLQTGEVIRVIQSTRLIEVSLVEQPAFSGARAWLE